MKNLLFLTLLITVSSAAQQVKQDYWYQKPMRILQTVLRQTDATNYDVDSLVRYMHETHANTLVVNGGGVVDFFQNTLPMANINPYMGKRDLLAEIVDGCHKADIKVIARVDFRGVDKERYVQHPDWFARNEKGGPIILDYTKPEMYAPCYNSFYRNEHAVEFIELLMEKYHLDGIWHNAVNFHNICYCDRCRKDYRKSVGKEIPASGSQEAEREEYYKWNAGVAARQLGLMRGTVKKYGSDKSYAAEVFDMYKIEQQKQTGISIYSAAEYFDFSVIVAFLAENSKTVEYKDIWYPAAIVKFLKSLEPGKSPVILFGGNGTEHRYIHAPPLDTRLWLWEAAAAGGGFWNCYFNGYYPANAPDARNAYLATDIYKYLKDNEFLKQIKPVTDIGVFYSKPSGEHIGDSEFSGSMRGVQRLMAENHYQYGFISDKMLTPKNLDKFKVLLMPNVTVLSNDQLVIIKEWVKKGGKLISTYQTSLFNEQWVQRSDFGLSEVFGVSYLNNVVNTEMDCYQKVIVRNDLVKGMENTYLLHNGGRTLMTKARSGAEVVTGYLPRIDNQPPENAFPDTWESEFPVIVRNSFGQGESIYFANETDKLNYTIGHPDYDHLMSNSINHLLGENKILKTDAPASVHIYLNNSDYDPEMYQLSLVNTSSSSHRPFRDLIPVERITIELPFNISSAETLYGIDNIVNFNKNILIINKIDEFCSLRIKKIR